MNKKELEKIKTIGVSGTFVLYHLIKHHNFPEEQAKEWIAGISTRLYTEDKKITEEIKKEFPIIKEE